MGYRKTYILKTVEEIPSGFDVHHIDGDRSNEHIRNLVALPRETHQEFHRLSMEYNIKISA